jgi:DivIVA domain-containing protein
MAERSVEVTTDVYTADNAWLSVRASVTLTGDAEPRWVEDLAILVLRNTFGVLPDARVPDVEVDLAEVNVRAAALGIVVTRFAVTVLGPGSERVEPPPVPAFSVVLRGYVRRETDALVGLAREALTAPGRRPELAEALRRPLPVALRGYDRAQVDAYLAMVAQALGA